MAQAHNPVVEEQADQTIVGADTPCRSSFLVSAGDSPNTVSKPTWRPGRKDAAIGPLPRRPAHVADYYRVNTDHKVIGIQYKKTQTNHNQNTIPKTKKPSSTIVSH